MRRNFYFLLCTFFVFGCYEAKALDSPPSFTGGHNQSLTICENSGTASINALMAITDADAGQTEYWFVVTGAMHGTLVATTSTFSTGGVVTPGGLSYTPATGYSGTDSFSVRITDGTYSDTTTVHVVINPLPSAITGTAGICRGLTSALSDGGGGTWASSSFIATVDPSSGVVTAVATGNATITYTLSTGCKTTRVVTVNPMANPITASAFSVCTGFSIGLSDAGGGTWGSVNPSVATINPGTGSLTGLSADTVTITYTLATGCTTSAVVTVNQTPAPITGVSNICLGNSTSLTETIPGGIWTSSNTAIATVIGGTVSGIAPGTVAFVYTLGTCTATKTMTINPVAPITGINSICAGGSAALANIYGGGVWSSAIPGVATVSSMGMVSGIAPGNTVVSYTLSTGCSSSVTMTINPVPLPITGLTSVCVGASTDLGESAGGGIWTSSNTVEATVDPSSGHVTGLAPGILSIIYSFSTGCKVTTFVMVNPLPVAIGGTLSVCSGFVTSLIEGGGGTWSSSDGSIASINLGSGVVSGISAGMATISYVLATGCATSTVVTVNQTPAAITGASGICLGAAITLGESVPGGVWSSSNTLIASVSGGDVTTFTGGIVAIVYTLGACTATKILTINTISPITGITSMCVGGTATLADAALGGMWSSASPGIATVNAYGLVTGITPGTLLVSYALPSGCFTSASITINPLPLPVEGITHMCVGGTTALSDAGGGAWTSSNTAIAIVNNITGIVTGLSTGAPNITYTLSTGCKTTTTITINPYPSPISGTLSVCAGYSTGLIEGGGGTWSSGTTLIATVASTGYVFGILPGVTTITYAFPTGCSTSTNVTVNPTPSPITGVPSLCQGDSATLSDALGGGVWSSPSTLISINAGTGMVRGLTGSLAPAGITYSVGSCAVTGMIYVNPVTPIFGDTSICAGTTTVLTNTLSGIWSSSNTVIAAISSAGVVSGHAPGAAVITYTFPTGCFTTKTFVVNPVPGPIEGSRAICIGATNTFSDSVSGGTWSSSAYALAGIDTTTGIATALATGTLTITYTIYAGCKVTVPITVNPFPFPISGPVYSCPGLTMALSDEGGGTWSSGNTAIATVNLHTGYVNTVSAGSVTITYTLLGCNAFSVITINPLPSPIVGDSFVCAGFYDTLSDVGGGLWKSGDETFLHVDTATGIVRGHAVGSAYIIYTLPTGCKTTKLITVGGCNEAVSQVATGNDLSISPNPNKGDFLITGSLGITGGDVNVSLVITNMLGQVVYKNSAIARNGNLNEHVQLANNIANGMYLLTVRSGSEYKAFHIVIQQ